MNTFESGRHPVNIAHLVMGIAFLGLVGIWALLQGDLVEGGGVRWLMPVPWVLAGLAGLLATTLGARRHATTQVGWVEHAEPAAPEGGGGQQGAHPDEDRAGRQDDGTPTS